MNLEHYGENKILMIDDEKDLLNLVETYLAKEGFKRFYKAETGAQGVELCKRVDPDIIILDVMLPDFDGFEVCRRIRKFSYEPILFLSAREEEVDKLLGLGMGGDDYVTKPFSLKEILFRVKAQLRRKQYRAGPVEKHLKAPLVCNFNPFFIDEERGEVKKNGSQIELTAKELQLFMHFVRNKNLILSKDQLYRAVWGEDYLGDDNTIMVHIRHLREKLEDDPGSPQFLVTVKGLGYKLVVKEEKAEL